MSVFIIAEAGVNHNGSLELAKKMVDAAKEAGVDCVKFQTFVSKNVVSQEASKAEYQKLQTDKNETQLEMLKKLELSFEEFIELNNYCDAKEIEFMSTAFDLESIDFLSSLEMKRWKIPSGEITNLPYLVKIAQLKKPVILSTGMSSMDEIRDALSILREHGATSITVLHCTSEYPAPYNEINLKAMSTIANEFNVKIGYSDHSKGIEVPIASTALGATIIEKHFTLDRLMDGPDHKASIDPDELIKMVKSIRNIELALGNGVKELADSESKNVELVRKSIVANCDIKKGTIFTEEMLTTKRPGNGITPMLWHDVIGEKAKKDFYKDEMIEC